MGFFISFEGPDGSGKSTQARALAAYLKSMDVDVVLTREPGGSPGAEEIRSMILSGDADKWSAVTECLLFNAARRDHMEKTVWPALKRGSVVITDRFADSTRAYQGATRAYEEASQNYRGKTTEGVLSLVEEIHRLAIGVEPDLTIMMTPSSMDDVGDALERALSRGATPQDGDTGASADESRFERMGVIFQELVALHFCRIAADNPDRCLQVASEGTIDEVSERVRLAIAERYPDFFPSPSSSLAF